MTSGACLSWAVLCPTRYLTFSQDRTERLEPVTTVAPWYMLKLTLQPSRDVGGHVKQGDRGERSSQVSWGKRNKKKKERKIETTSFRRPRFPQPSCPFLPGVRVDPEMPPGATAQGFGPALPNTWRPRLRVRIDFT